MQLHQDPFDALEIGPARLGVTGLATRGTKVEDKTQKF